MEDDEEMVQALHNDVADDLLHESAEQVGEVIDSEDNDTLGIEGGEMAVSSMSPGLSRVAAFLNGGT